MLDIVFSNHGTFRHQDQYTYLPHYSSIVQRSIPHSLRPLSFLRLWEYASHLDPVVGL